MSKITPTTIETVTGKLVDLLNPDPKQICIEDIAWALSRMPRFTGHTISKIPLSVAQHSVFVANRVKEIISEPMDSEIYFGRSDKNELILKALLHDASEIYTSDIPSPVKKLPGFYPLLRELEARIYDAMFLAFNISPVTAEEKNVIKAADLYAQKLEAHAYMISRGLNWDNLPNVSIIELQNFEDPLTNIEAYEKFLEMFHNLTNGQFKCPTKLG